ncbi:MAG TPA: PAS domain S-box protein, partial [Methanosarcina sp.]|nr:PAS domain S-box protein [Methanosarcina sp.]
MEQFLEHNQNPVLRVKKDGIVLYSNEASKPLLHEWGTKVGEKLPSSIVDIVQKVITQNSPEKIEVKAGIRIYLIVFHPLPEQGCVNISGFDISEQKEIEGKLRESEKKYRIVANNTFDWEFWLGPDGRFLYMSPSCERFTGYAVWEFMDNPDLLQEIIHSDDRQAFLQHKHETSPSSHGDIEFRIITKNGEIRWIHHLCQPLYDGKGCYAGNLGSNRDITERKRAEEALKLTQASVDLAADYILWITPNGKVIYANNAACKSLKYSRDELQEMYVWDFDLIYTKEVWLEHWLDIKKRGSFSFESLHHAKDMREFPVEVSVNYVRSGDMEFNFAYIKDITER